MNTSQDSPLPPYHVTNYHNEDSNSAFVKIFKVAFLMLNQSICVLGVVTNAVNLTVFSRLWHKSSTNIGLYAMAVSDLMVSSTSMICTLLELPWLNELLIDRFDFYPSDFVYLIPGSLNMNFSRTTMMITACVTLERCFCVAMPHTFKTIFTRGRVKAYMVICFILGTLMYLPIYHVYDLGWTYHPAVNKSLFGYIISQERYSRVKSWSNRLTVVFFYGLQYSAINVSTAVLIVTLNKRRFLGQAKKTRPLSKGINTPEGGGNRSAREIKVERKKVRGQFSREIEGDSSKEKGQFTRETEGEIPKGRGLSTKDVRVVKMLIMIACLFIVCYIPSVFTMMKADTDKDFRLRGRLKDLFMYTTYAACFFVTVNSSLNFFIYYTYNSNYVDTFNDIFKIGNKK